MPDTGPRPRRRRRVLRGVGLALLAALAVAPACGGDEPPPAAPPAPARPPPRVPATKPPSLVLVVVDTLRRDMLGLPGDAGGAGRMPHLAAEAERGLAMRHAVAASSWTLPSMTSLLTGLLPSRHGADSQDDLPVPIAPDATFAGWLHDVYGYDTAFLTAGPWMGGRGVAQGFGYVRTDFHLAGLDTFLDAWMPRRQRDRPYLLVLHSFEVHDPYGEANHPWPETPLAPGAPLSVEEIESPWLLTERFLTDRDARSFVTDPSGPTLFRRVLRCMNGDAGPPTDPAVYGRLRSAYEAGVSWCDGLLAQAIARLEARGLLDDALLVVAADHGEAFGEHGIVGHGRRLDEDLLRVPLVLRGGPPFTGGRVVDVPVGLIDLLPTYLDWAGLDGPPGLDGRSFLDRLSTEAPPRPIRSEVRAVPGATMAEGEVVRRSVLVGSAKAVLTYDVFAGTVRESLFDVTADPGEQHDLAVDGVVPGALARDRGICSELEALRDGVWALARSLSARASAALGGEIGPLQGERPASCEAR